MFLEWSRTGRLDLDAFVTARYRLDDILEATTALEQGKISGRSIITY
jgi:Zn-dependent alcohol dehydrogenase